MHLDEAMKVEAKRLEEEIISIDLQLEKLHKKIDQLIALRKNREHDLRALKTSFTQADESLMEILNRRPVTV